MHVLFKHLVLKNFKSHQDITVNFGERTDILGDNTKGKSTLLESISYSLYGTDLFGGKMDPLPITYDSEETLVSLLLEVDEKNILLGRGLKKGEAQYYINEVPAKATEFKELVDSLFDKELFYSLFNPSYFFTLGWEKQRAMLLQYVSAPARSEVLKNLHNEQSKQLETLLKKHSLDDLEKIHKDNKNKKDKAYIAAQSRTKTLKEQLEANAPTAPLDTLKIELNQLIKQRDEIEKVTDSAGENNRKINVLQNRINAMLTERDHLKEDHKRVKGEYEKLESEPVKDICRVCQQSLQGESLKAAELDKQKQLDKLNAQIVQIKTQHKNVVVARKELEEELSQLEYIDVSEQLEKARELQAKISPLEHAIFNHKQYERLQEEVNQAQIAEKETLQSLNESIFILDSIKAFRAKEAELQGEKVQALFTTLSVRLFKQNKTDGEIKPDFEIEMNGKPYRTLSLSEGIRAGLELREVLSKQSELIAPCMVDNAESITTFKAPTGQLIISRVVADKELTIEQVNA